MPRKLLFFSLICVLIGSMVLTGCNGTDTTPADETATPAETTATPTGSTDSTGSGNWWDEFGEPQYGGTITLRVNELASLKFDPYSSPYMSDMQISMWYECLFNKDWTVDREDWTFKAEFMPDQYAVSGLAETWEQPDAQTIIIHLREGVYWQDKDPVNGRELVADDVVYHYNRICGIGGGFTEPSPFWSHSLENIESVTADNQYTVTFTFKQPSATNFTTLANTCQPNYIEAAEWVNLGEEGMNDWQNTVGTGPWILNDYTENSAMYFVKNPNYWGTDERYPDNQLPYADEIDVLCIPDDTTALAALRTGQIDIMTGVDWQQAEIVANSNPEIEQVEIPSAGDYLLINMNEAPFNDINVRKAMNMAINRELIAQTHYGGTVDGTPCSRISPSFEGYAYAYEDWPQELKDEYSYNPEAAIQLLADAGYPDGFTTTCTASSTSDLDLLQIVQAQFKDIGIEMSIETLEMAAFTTYINSAMHELAGPSQMGYGVTSEPSSAFYSSTQANPSTVNDPDFDAMIVELSGITDTAELMQKVQELDQYYIEHHWGVNLGTYVEYNLYQPYLKGYSGENIGFRGFMGYYARWWLDQEE